MINHIRSMLLWTHPAKLAADSPRYHLVPHGFSTPPLPAALAALKRALVPDTGDDLELLYDRVDALLVCCHCPELEPFTRIHDSRITYITPCEVDSWLDGNRLTVSVHRNTAAADLSLTARRASASDAAPGTKRGWLVRRVSGTQTLSITPASGTPYVRTVSFAADTTNVKLSTDISLVIRSPTRRLEGEFTVNISDRVPATLDIPKLAESALDPALAAYNEALGTPVRHAEYLERLVLLLRADHPPHISLGAMALVLAYLSSAVWEASS